MSIETTMGMLRRTARAFAAGLMHRVKTSYYAASFSAAGAQIDGERIWIGSMCRYRTAGLVLVLLAQRLCGELRRTR